MASNALIAYKLDNGDDMNLTPGRVRELRVIGDKDKVSDRAVTNFMMLCKAHRLNPFTREAYLIKYGSSPATLVVGKEVFTKRAQKNPRFKGFEAGVSVLSSDKTKLTRRDGSMVVEGETLVGGWCRVYVDGYENPMFDEVSMREYSTGKSNWTSKPATMIRKTAIVHALREAFPDEFGGLYDAVEMGVGEEDMPEGDVEQPRIEAVYETADEASAAPDGAEEEKGLAGLATEAVCANCGNVVSEVAADATAQDLDAGMACCESPSYELR